MKIRYIIRDYFTFSKGERIGLTILIVLMALVFVADRLIFYFETPAEADKERFIRVVSRLEQQAKKPASGSLFAFDPNTIDSVALDSLALPPRVRHNLLRYRSRGGIFQRKDDVRRIYGMNDSVYDAIAGYLAIQERAAPVSAPASGIRGQESGQPRSFRAVPALIIELNAATAGELIRLPGIGPVLSERIIKYRNLLGGFHSPAQLKEVYGLTEETLKRIEGQVVVDSTRIVTININFAEAAELSRHLYLDRRHAGKIIGYRTKTGFIGDKFQLLRDSVLPPEVFAKVHPYLQTSD